MKDNDQPPVIDIDEEEAKSDSKFLPTHLDDFEIEGEEDELSSVNTFDILEDEDDDEDDKKDRKHVDKSKDMTVNPFTDEKIKPKKKRRKKKFLKILKKIFILLITLIIVAAILFGVYWFFIKDNEDFKKHTENETTEVELNDENDTNDTTNTVEVISGFKPKAVANTKKYEDRVMEQLMNLKQITDVMISKGDKEYQFRLVGNTLFVRTYYKIYATGNKANNSIMKCSIGDGELSISCTGDVYPCQLLHNENFYLGNIHENSLEEIYNSDKNNRFKTHTVECIDKCRDCDFKYLCGGACQARHFSETGNIDNAGNFCEYEKKGIINGLISACKMIEL